MRLAIPADQIRRFRGVLRRAGRREVGGVLMAEQIAAGDFRIVDFSLDAESGSAAHFVRSPEHHGAALDAFFARTGSDYTRFNYLGEWHSHPRFPVVPSIADAKSMTALVHGERSISFAVLLILRLRWFRGLECSATAFAKGRRPSVVQVIIEPLASRPSALCSASATHIWRATGRGARRGTP